MDLGAVGPIWLDVTRLLSRVGRAALTGIDRVELAYLDHILGVADPDSRFLCRTTRGFLLLDRRGGTYLREMVRGQVDLGRADLWSRLSGRRNRPRHRAEAALRPSAVDRCLPRNLAALLRRQGAGARVTYLNVGHSNLSETVLGPLSDAKVRIGVMIHDLIPLTHPQTVVPDLPTRFADRIARVRRYADIVICNSAATQHDLTRHWDNGGAHPVLVIARLGLDRVRAQAVSKDPRSFVMLGTIEARKNHALILEAWDIMASRRDLDDLPRLHIIGPRGWCVDDVLMRLDQHPLNGSAIFVHGPLDEGTIRTQLAKAQALLFPSIAEGFGFPPLEALALGTLPIVSDLRVLRETLGAQAVYLPCDDAYSWAATIEKLVDGKLSVSLDSGIALPDWNSHFESVAQALGQDRVEGP